ncbi:MAG: hypothetical protein PF518_01960 [Spirochaetaceae bacterium]|nr:hypothetical protein [Spirochaetaceae bacterium]
MFRKKKLCLVILIIFTISGCQQKKENRESGQQLSKNEVELNLVKPETTPKQQNNPPAVQEIPKPKIDFFLSGRTELLSLKSGQSISAEDFEIGPLYENKSASTEEISIIETCNLFFESLKTDNPRYNLIDPLWFHELKDYIDYFISGKLVIENIIYGKPEIKGKKIILAIRVYPGKVSGFLYLNKNNANKWLISGLEMDLKREENRGEELWFPSLSPSPFGYSN